MTPTNLFSISLTLFLIMDPLGNIPVFLSVLSKVPAKNRRKVIFRELCIALLVMVFFFFLGNAILKLLHIQPFAVQITGGIILFLIAIPMIFPKAKTAEEKVDTDPFIVPLAIPLVAGPSILATIMIYARNASDSPIVLSGIMIAWVFTTVILLSSSWFSKVLGTRGLRACERLMGLILTLLAVQLFLQGIETLIRTPIVVAIK
ncbi:MAG: NAAT family transporter [Parachlamydiales bacterium]|nr:NAAT family transporter [Parachlamydiales bacterium]